MARNKKTYPTTELINSLNVKFMCYTIAALKKRIQG